MLCPSFSFLLLPPEGMIFLLFGQGELAEQAVDGNNDFSWLLVLLLLLELALLLEELVIGFGGLKTEMVFKFTGVIFRELAEELLLPPPLELEDDSPPFDSISYR